MRAALTEKKLKAGSQNFLNFLKNELRCSCSRDSMFDSCRGNGSISGFPNIHGVQYFFGTI
jgi:hypothetical protein